MPNLNALSSFPIQSIPGVGNVQVIPASSLQGLTQVGQGTQHQSPSTATLQVLPSGATQIIGQQVQQDPTDPSKWQILQSINGNTLSQIAPGVVVQQAVPITQISSDAQQTQQTVTSGIVSTVDTATPVNKPRVRRVACTCPNCREGER